MNKELPTTPPAQHYIFDPQGRALAIYEGSEEVRFVDIKAYPETIERDLKLLSQLALEGTEVRSKEPLDAKQFARIISLLGEKIVGYPDRTISLRDPISVSQFNPHSVRNPNLLDTRKLKRQAFKDTLKRYTDNGKGEISYIPPTLESVDLSVREMVDLIKETQTLDYSLNGTEILLPIQSQDSLETDGLLTAVMLELLLSRKKLSLKDITDEINLQLTLQEKVSFCGHDGSIDKKISEILHYLDETIVDTDQGPVSILQIERTEDNLEISLDPAIKNVKRTIRNEDFQDIKANTTDAYITKPSDMIPVLHALKSDEAISDTNWKETSDTVIDIVNSGKTSVSQQEAITILDSILSSRGLDSLKNTMKDNGTILRFAHLKRLLDLATQSLGREGFGIAVSDRTMRGGTVVQSRSTNSRNRATLTSGLSSYPPSKDKNPIYYLTRTFDYRVESTSA